MTQAKSFDPTPPSAFCPAYPAAPVSLSRNEIETLCLKAARGAGMSWGLAEEAGFAAGWLAAQGIDGASALVGHLQDLVPCAIVVRDRHWTATSGAALCPILLGAALDDHAALEAGPWSAPITIKVVYQPILLLPFLARAARICAKPLDLKWPGGSLLITPSCDVTPGAMTALSRIEVTALTVSPISEGGSWTAPVQALVTVSAATIEKLNILALRTTVPASVTSRHGAGAATSDND